MKIKIAIFFSLLFINLIIAPAIISLVHDNQEISILLDVNDEEEKKGEESSKDLEIKLQNSQSDQTLNLQDTFRKKNIRCKSTKYSSKFSKVNTPPPELIA